MKLFIFLTLLASTNVYAAGRTVTFTSGSPGVATYDTTGKSLIASDVGAMHNWELTNYTPYELDCRFTGDSHTAPPNGNGVLPGGGGSFTNEFFLTASEHLPLYNFTTRNGTSLWCRGDVSAPTSGILKVNAW